MMRRHNRPTAYVIFATQRTGSTWLMSALDAHPAIVAYDELLLAGGTGSGYWGRRDLEFFDAYYSRRRRHDNRLARAYWSFRYLDGVFSSRPEAMAVGMKLMYDQLWKHPWLWLYLIRRRVRVVHLVRSNLLDVILSVETARARKQPHAWAHDAVDTPAVRLDPRHVVSTLKTLRFRVGFARWLLALLPIDCTEVCYEQLTVDPSLLDEIVSFLGAPAQSSATTAGSRFKKLNTARRSELIRNYAEVEQALRGTRFECFLEA